MNFQPEESSSNSGLMMELFSFQNFQNKDNSDQKFDRDLAEICLKPQAPLDSNISPAIPRRYS